MRAVMIFLILTIATTGWFFLWPSAIAAMIVTKEEINACAVMIAQKDYRREYNWTTKQWVADVRPIEDATESLIVDEGERPDFLAKKIAYERRFSIPTVYTRYVNEGSKLCIRKKLLRQKIEMPVLSVRDGSHVARWNGSAALVRNGESEPVFGCIEGYHPTGSGCVKN